MTIETKPFKEYETWVVIEPIGRPLEVADRPRSRGEAIASATLMIRHPWPALEVNGYHVIKVKITPVEDK